MKDRIFIIGCGPSLEGFDFNLLKDEDTIAVNYAVKEVINPTYFMTADSGVIRKAVNSKFWEIPKSTTKIVVMGPEHPRFFAVKNCLKEFDVTIQPCRFDGYIGFDFKHFATGKNTGFCALQYAVLLDYKKIFLLGIDLGKRGGRKYFYPSQTSSDSPYDVFLHHFVTGLKRLKLKTDYQVRYCSKPSRLDKFIDFMCIEDALK